jgi:hypothetical protein
MKESVLAELVSAFNRRDFDRAAAQAAEGLLQAEGRDEVFWLGLGDACEGYSALMGKRFDRAEQHFLVAMQNLRNFGFSYNGFNVTGLLAGLRRCSEEARQVQAQNKRSFDITLLPQLKLAQQVEQNV